MRYMFIRIKEASQKDWPESTDYGNNVKAISNGTVFFTLNRHVAEKYGKFVPFLVVIKSL